MATPRQLTGGPAMNPAEDRIFVMAVQRFARQRIGAVPNSQEG